MSKLRYDINYAQFGDADREGEITFNNQTITASGRLDEIGSSVFAEGFVCGAHGELVAVIEATRASETTIDFEVGLSRRNTPGMYMYDFIHSERITGVLLTTVPPKASEAIDRIRRLGIAAHRAGVEGDPGAGDGARGDAPMTQPRSADY